jgi:hypothetical protein
MNKLWPLENPLMAKRFLSKKQYLQLIHFLQSGFVLRNGRAVTDSSNKRAPLRSNKGYYAFDYVYLSTHNYNSFYTCNQWATDALHAAEIRNAVFSPFGWGLFHQLKK